MNRLARAGCVYYVIGESSIVQNASFKGGGDKFQRWVNRHLKYPSLDAEAVRAIGSSPKWTPATIDGTPVPMSIIFPVQFFLMD